MLVITDMNGVPITEPSRPCGLFSAVNKKPDAVQRCISSWHDLGQALTMEPAFHTSHLGLLCARGLIRVGTELQGMVVAGCVGPGRMASVRRGSGSRWPGNLALRRLC